MNINTKKYYDSESIGGGVPEEVNLKIMAKYPPTFTTEAGVSMDATWYLIQRKAASYGYSLATEKLKEQEQEIERLKQENERLRGVINTASSKLDEYIFDVYEICLRHEKMLSNDVSMMLDTLEGILIPPPPKSK